MKTRAVCFVPVALVLFLSPVHSRASDGIETAGNVLQIVLPAFSLGQTIYERDKTGALQFGESFALSMGVTYGLKYTVVETRPNGGSHSFPSGHSAASFTAAEYTRKRYGWAWGIPMYVAASFVAYSRVESNQHHPHDVAVGAGIGIASSFLFTRPFAGFNVQPNVGRKSAGVTVSKQF